MLRHLIALWTLSALLLVEQTGRGSMLERGEIVRQRETERETETRDQRERERWKERLRQKQKQK